MSAVSSLVPARFLTIIAHLVIVITIFWSRENNVKASLPLEFTQEEYDYEDRSVLPAFVEILLFIAVFGLKKKPL
ncbi:transmembrane protein 107 like isoform X4 [Echeneis naucrates]|uniref:transmembrane protein 107 like isoform X4 n=1 Tax=Echeneis naucrates TaxID=173247 RepID=UPI0011142655|nr:transmembrane protein 107 isoform X4 [Echeneis naucrates]